MNKPEIVVLEIGRPITDDVKVQIEEPHAVISYHRSVTLRSLLDEDTENKLKLLYALYLRSSGTRLTM